MSISIQYVGLTCGMFTRDGVEIPCPDSAAGLYIQTRNDQIVKVYILLLELQVILDDKNDINIDDKNDINIDKYNIKIHFWFIFLSN